MSTSTNPSAKAPSPEVEAEDYLDETIRATNLPKFPYEGDIVIAGVACRLPMSNNISEFQDNLFSKKHLITNTEAAGRYKIGLYGNPANMGAMPHIDKFDASFFNMYPSMVLASDPNVRMLQERVYEAIVDAGESLESVKGTKTGVYIGALPSDSGESMRQLDRINPYSFIGYVPCHLANRLSYFFDLKGPSFTIDSACSSTMAALENAVMQIRLGHLDSAIVGTCNLCIDPLGTLLATSVGMLADDGKCKAFDAAASGFVRADGNIAVLITKRSLAKRVYGTILHMRGNNDGFTKEGIAVPSGDSQSDLFRVVYEEMGIDPNQVFFAECHGPGTVVGDGVEVDALAKHLCSNRKQPLYVGSVKTNLGHCEGSAGLASLTKAIIAMHTMRIPPNLHFKNPNPNIKSLCDGRVAVPTEPVTFERGIMSVSSFGVGGTNYNVCLRCFKNEKRAPHPASKTPRLFTYGARTNEAGEAVLEEARKYKEIVEYQALLQTSANLDANKAPYRVYEVFNAKTDTYQAVKKVGFQKRQLWLSFTGMGGQWPGMGKSLMKLDLFRQSIERFNEITKPLGVDLVEVIMTSEQHKFQNTIFLFLGITSIGMALFDLLKAMDLKVDGLVGHSLGETVCGYADGCLTATEAITMSYWRGRVGDETSFEPGAMIAAGLSWQEAEALCPPGAWPACNNGAKTVTISGLKHVVDQLVVDLKAMGKFARPVQSTGLAYHCPCVQPAMPIIDRAMRKVIVPKRRSDKWLSSSYPEKDWESEECKWMSVDYLRNNMQKPVWFYDTIKKIPNNAVVIEVATHPLFQNILKQTIGPKATVLCLMRNDQADNLEHFLSQMGTAYVQGIDMNPLGLYPAVKFPVPKGTPYVSTLINKSWDHTISWYVPNPERDRRKWRGNELFYDVDYSKTESSYLKDHMINGKNYFPVAGFIVMAWKSLATKLGKIFEEMAVVLKDLQILGTKEIIHEGEMTFMCRTQTNGSFEVSQGPDAMMKGFMCCMDDDVTDKDDHDRIVRPDIPDIDLQAEPMTFTMAEVANLLASVGVDVDGEFKGILAADSKFNYAELKWTGNWTAHLDSILRCISLNGDIHRQGVVTSISRVDIDPMVHWEASDTRGEDEEVMLLKTDSVSSTTVVGGIALQNVTFTLKEPVPLHRTFTSDKVEFVPFKEAKASQAKPEVQKYTTACNEYCIAGFRQLMEQNGQNNNFAYWNAIKNVIAKETSKYRLDGQIAKYVGDGKHGVADYLQEMFQLKIDDGFEGKFKNLMNTCRTDLFSDELTVAIVQNDMMIPALNIVMDNQGQAMLDLLEVDANRSALYRTFCPFISKNPRVQVKYTAAYESEIHPEVAETYALSPLKWTLSSPEEEKPQNKSSLVVLHNVLSRQPDVQTAFAQAATLVQPNGFMLIEELTHNSPLALAMTMAADGLNTTTSASNNVKFLREENWLDLFQKNGFEVVYQRSNNLLSSVFLLLRPKTEIPKDSVRFVNVSTPVSDWLSDLQSKHTEVTTSENELARLWLYSNTPNTGLLGLFQSLCQESGASASRIRCILQEGKTGQKTGPLTPDTDAFRKIARQDLTVNLCSSDGVWGFQAALPVQADADRADVPTSKAYLSMKTFGDLSTFQFLKSATLRKLNRPKEPVKWVSVYYAALNWTDVAIATGKQIPESVTDLEGLDQSVLGSEFVAKDTTGRRIMGFGLQKMIATEVNLGESVFVDVPESMSMQQAASIFTAYSTALFALVLKAKVKKGWRVLVHSGAADVGQAAIFIALQSGAEVFTTVDSDKKMKFLKSKFPQLKDDHMASSRDTAFEQKFLKTTGGKGVHVVLNNLHEDKLLASMRVLAKGGIFLELRHFSTSLSGQQEITSYLRHKSIITIDMRHVMTSPDTADDRQEVLNMLVAGMREGYIKPLQTTVYGYQNVQGAFEAAKAGNDTGKILIQFRQEEGTKTIPKPLHVPAMDRAFCDPNLTYIVVEGLSYVGLVLANFLVSRGCRRLVLTAREAVTSAYQKHHLDQWKSEDVQVSVLTTPLATQAQVKDLLNKAKALGAVGGMAVAPLPPQTCSFKDMTSDTFQAMVDARLSAVTCLDQLSREPAIRDNLHSFLVLSSVAGTIGQANGAAIAYADASIAKIMENRAADKLPAHNIQIGNIANGQCMGNTPDTLATFISSLAAQSMMSFVRALDQLMCSPYAVTSSFVVPDENSSESSSKSTNTRVQLCVAKEFGFADFSNFDPDLTMNDLGMDSIMGNQIKGALETHCKITITTKEIYNLSINDLATLG